MAAGNQPPFLHPAQDLADVALGHQQLLRELLLRDTLVRSHVRQYVELPDAQPVGAQVLGRCAVHFVVDLR